MLSCWQHTQEIGSVEIRKYADANATYELFVGGRLVGTVRKVSGQWQAIPSGGQYSATRHTTRKGAIAAIELVEAHRG